MIKINRLSKPTILQEKELSWTEELCQERKAYFQEKNKFAHTLKKYIVSSAPYAAMTRSKLKAMGVYTAILQNI